MYRGIEIQDWTQGHVSYSLLYPFFFLSLYCMLTLEICVRVLSGIVEVRILKPGIYMDNVLMYCGIENQTFCSYSSLNLFIFLSFKANFVSQFSHELRKQESSNMVLFYVE